MTIACISDLHGYLPIYPSKYWEGIEKCELLLICGDIIPLYIQFDNPASKKWLLNDFLTWANSLPVNKILFIAGNHDQVMERDDNWMHKNFSKCTKVTYLKNELYTYINCYGKEYKIFGTPYCHQFGNWPFMYSNEVLKEKFSKIPKDLDILITHDPPTLGEVGVILDREAWNYRKQCGNQILTEVILNVTPKHVFSGHIHSGNHQLCDIESIKLANVSVVDELYNMTYKPLVYEINY